MIEKIKIINFQVHRKKIVVFDPHVTVITGITDSGKSSIIRALNWVCKNKPSGDSFVSQGKSYSDVVLTVDGREITRHRGEENLYKLDGNKYYSFGKSGVPEDIDNLLNVGVVNFQSQHEQHFWFSLTPGEVSKELNQVINLGLIDDTLANIANTVRNAKSSENYTEQRLSEAKKKLEELSWVEQANVKLKKIEKLNKLLKDLDEKGSRIASTISEVETLTEDLQSGSRAILCSAKVVSLGKEVRSYRDKIDSLEKTIKEIKKINKSFEEIPLEDFSKIRNLKDQFLAEKNKEEKLEELLSKLSIEDDICQLKEEIEKLEKEKKLMMKERCPLCGKTTR